VSSVVGLLGVPVRWGGIRLGAPVDALLDPSLRRVLGFEVAGRDGVRRFAPWGACEVGAAEIGIGTALSLLGRPELDYYRARAASLSELRRVDVLVGETVVGRIDDLLVDREGRVSRLVLQGRENRVELPPERLGLPRPRWHSYRPGRGTAGSRSV
jgi:hypothetical protein